MMIDLQPPHDPIIAVIADKPEFHAEAVRIASHLRRNGTAVVTYFAGNSKKQTDRARRDGADAVLYVRDLAKTRDSVHLSHSPQSALGGTELLLAILDRLPDEYQQLSGDNLK